MLNRLKKVKDAVESEFTAAVRCVGRTRFSFSCHKNVLFVQARRQSQQASLVDDGGEVCVTTQNIVNFLLAYFSSISHLIVHSDVLLHVFPCPLHE